MLEWIARYRVASPRRVVGLMSGTSVDGIDAALVELSGQGRSTRWEIVCHVQHPMPGAVREAVLTLAGGFSPDSPRSPDSSMGPAAELARLDVCLGELFARAALHCVHEAGLQPTDLHLIASHGQTVCHRPIAASAHFRPAAPSHLRQSGGTSEGELGVTLQLGRGTVIAAQTGIPVLCDFRSQDVALGGQGAPLVPFADWVIFSVPGRVRAIQNLGGIGNVTYLPGIDPGSAMAFDTGPANMLLDGAVRRITAGERAFDKDSHLARTGRVSSRLLAWLLEHPFLSLPPPRSTGHEDFGEVYLGEIMARAADWKISDSDLAATLTAFGPEAAVRAYRSFMPRFPDEVILGGGGSLNPLMVEHFQRLCSPAEVRLHEVFGIPAQAKEALAFVILANETMLGRSGVLPESTGASRPATLGCFCPPPMIDPTEW